MYYGSKLIDLWTDGLEIAEIAVSLHKTEEEVLESLVKFKDDNVVTGGGRGRKTVYTDLFVEAIIDRYVRGIGQYNISRELKMSSLTIPKIIKDSKFNADMSDLKVDGEVIEWDDFTTCPICNDSKEVYSIGKGMSDFKDLKDYTPNSVCHKCSVEWIKSKGETKLIKYHNID